MSQERVQGESGVSVESQVSLKENLKLVQRESGEGPERVKRWSRESKERVS